MCKEADAQDVKSSFS